MSRKRLVFALPGYEEIPVSEHSQTLKLVLKVCQSQQERIVFLEETVAQLKDEIAILKGEKPRPPIKPSALNTDRPEGGDPSRGQPRRDRGRRTPPRCRDFDKRRGVSRRRLTGRQARSLSRVEKGQKVSSGHSQYCLCSTAALAFRDGRQACLPERHPFYDSYVQRTLRCFF